MAVIRRRRRLLLLRVIQSISTPPRARCTHVDYVGRAPDAAASNSSRPVSSDDTRSTRIISRVQEVHAALTVKV